MKKYFLLFAVSSFIGISHAIAQSSASVTISTGQSVIVPDSVSSSDNTASKGTITKAGKNEQSVYTPATGASQNNNPGAASPAQQASPNKEQPAVIDPKRQR
jgi:hypothetical protein